VPPVVALLADFCQIGIFSRGFLCVCIIYIACRISTAVMAGDILFFSLAGPVGDYTGAHTVVLSRVFFFIFSRWKSEAALGRSGVHSIF
jgi:hypothetical protein